MLMVEGKYSIQFYSILLCGRSPGAGEQLDLWSEPTVFGPRAVFIPGPPAHLRVTNITKAFDEGKSQSTYTYIEY
jgi:hypothetical protein